MDFERWNMLMAQVAGLLKRGDMQCAHRILTEMVAEDNGEDPPRLASTRITLAFVCGALGRDDEADRLMLLAEAVLKEANDGQLPIQCLAWRARAWDRRDFRLAERLYRQCLQRLEQGLEEDIQKSPLNAVHCMRRVAEALAGQGRRDAARAMFRTAAEQQTTSPNQAREAAMASVRLGEMLLVDGEIPEASAWLTRTYELYSQSRPPALEYAYLLYLMGKVAMIEGDLDKAENVFKHSLALCDLNPFDGSYAFLPTGPLLDLGRLRLVQKRHEEAVAFLLRARDAGGPREAVQASYMLLGQSYLDLRQYEQAERCLAKVLEMAADSEPVDPARKREIEEALDRARKGLARPPGQRGPLSADDILLQLRHDRGETALADPEYAVTLIEEAEKQKLAGRWDRLVMCLKAAQTIYENAFGHDHETVIDILYGQARGLHVQGLEDQAEAAVREALAIFHRIGRQGQFGAGELLNALAAHLIERKAYAEAVEILGQAVAAFERTGQKRREMVSVMMNLGGAHLKLGQEDEAESWYLRAIALAQQLEAGKPITADVARRMVRLASLYARRGKLELAMPVIDRAVDALRRTLGEAHAEVVHALVVQQELGRRLREKE